jgi:Uma2 family endonuclease
MTATLLPKAEVFVQTGITWNTFKAIQQGFESVPNIRLNYCEGELEILGISKPHEALRCILALLLGVYFEEKGIEFFPSGSYSQSVEGVTEYQSDLSYCFGTDKECPDLSIEIVITSGSTKKLQKYKCKGVPEVWFWKRNKFTLHRLENDDYVQVTESKALEGIDLESLVHCMMMNSKLEAVKTFRAIIRG